MAKREYSELTGLDKRLNTEMAGIARRAIFEALIDEKIVTWTTAEVPWILRNHVDAQGRFTDRIKRIRQVGVYIVFELERREVAEWSVLGEDFAEISIDGEPLKVELE